MEFDLFAVKIVVGALLVVLCFWKIVKRAKRQKELVQWLRDDELARALHDLALWENHGVEIPYRKEKSND